MGRFARWFALFTLFIALPAALCAGCSCSGGRGEPAVRAAVDTKGGEGERQYYLLYDSGRTERIKEFKLDRAARFVADIDDFSSEMVDGKITVTVRDTAFTTGGAQYEADSVMKDIMEAAAKETVHEIIYFEIIREGGNYYVFEKLNVNLWTPCRLFSYDRRSGTLTFLGEWDDVELAGLNQPE